jgi:branched-chain amino acid transport system substrate-binding protein
MLKELALVFLLIGATLSFTSCSKQSSEIKIGCVFPLTGSGALWGQNGRKGVELAVGEINKDGGINGKKIHIIYEDSQTESRFAVASFQKLINVDNIQACIVDMISSNVLAIAPIAEDKKVVIISPGASSPKITNAGEYVFRNWPSDALQGKEAARIAFNKLGWQTAGIFYINNEYGDGLDPIFKKEFEKLGGKIIVEESFQQGSSDFRTGLLNFKNKKIDGIYLVGYPKEVPIILKQSEELKLKTHYLGTETFEDPAILTQAGSAAEGVVYLIPGTPNDQSLMRKNFLENFKKKFNEAPGVPADVAYDAVYILKRAIDKAGYNSEKIKDQLYKLKDWEGASGLTSFDSNGDAIKPFDVKTIKDGKFTLFSNK